MTKKATESVTPLVFRGSISRRLSLALTAIIAAVLLVGGVSLVLAVRIFQINQSVDEQNAHIRLTGQIQTGFQRIVHELQQAHALGRLNPQADLPSLQEALARHLEVFIALHAREEGFPEEQQERALIADLKRPVRELQALGERVLAASGRVVHLDVEDLAQLDAASRDVGRKSAELDSIHRLKVDRLLQASQAMMRVIVGLYLAFLLVGGALIALASIALTRGIAAPLRTLADAALEIAEGRLDKKVAVLSPDEIGQLSHAFNVMAERLQARERELRAAHDQLKQKVRETQTLHRIGTEILGLRQLDRILQSVVDKAGELLGAEAAALCMLTPEQDELVAVATSGTAEAFRPSRSPTGPRLAARTPLGPDGPEAHVRQCTVLQPEFLQAHLAAPLPGADRVIGMLCIGGRSPRAFMPAETELLKGLATQAALAIENARLTEEVRSLATLEERERIAREMHDGLAQALGLLHLKLRWAERQAGAGDSAAGEALREMATITERAYEDVRQSIFGLRTMVSRGLGLVPTLTEYLHEFSAQTGIAVELEVAGGRPIHVPPASEVQLVRIVQEALTNVRKHAGAGRAWVRLGRQDGWVQVTVQDDGRGFNPDALVSQGALHFGLQTMRERAEALGGKLEIEAAPGHGTRIVARLPGEA